MRQGFSTPGVPGDKTDRSPWRKGIKTDRSLPNLPQTISPLYRDRKPGFLSAIARPLKSR
ncbi:MULTISPECIES: hypothetical protein [unclassified Microcoleus]